MSSDSDFNWYCFYEVGCELLEKEGEKYWRSAIGRFYYAAFCEARDFLISNNIYHTSDLNKDLRSETGASHKATQNIFKYANDLKDHNFGWNVHNRLKELKDYRSLADYYSECHDFKNMAKRSKDDAKFIFKKLAEY